MPTGSDLRILVRNGGNNNRLLWLLGSSLIIVLFLVLVPGLVHQQRLLELHSRNMELIGAYLFTASSAQSNDFCKQVKEVRERWSWRAAVLSKNIAVPADVLDIDWTKSWKAKAGGVFDRSGYPTFARKDGSASVLSISGPGTALGDGFCGLDRLPPDLILFVEYPLRDIPWMSPQDFTLEDLDHGRGRRPGSESGNGFLVVFADGSIWLLKENTPSSLISKLATIERANANDRDTIFAGQLIHRCKRRNLNELQKDELEDKAN